MAVICGMLLNTETILLLIQQTPEVAKYVHNIYSLLSQFSLYLHVHFYCVELGWVVFVGPGPSLL